MVYNPSMTKDEEIFFWRDGAEHDTVAMRHLLQSRDYHWALFIGHLVIEKLLKALYIKNGKGQPPFTHDLCRIADKAGLSLSEVQKDWLDTVTTFNVSARYDNYKQQFYVLCTPEFSQLWAGRIEEMRTWLMKQL
jgi:HEPN domain-containing protein